MKPTLKQNSSKTKSKAKKTHRIAVYPGSFDPITLGHLDIIQRISKQFDEVIVLIAESPEKKALFTLKERENFIRQSLKDLTNVKVDSHQGLTVQYAKAKEAHVLVRGLRAIMDFEYEIGMANLNFGLAPEIETMLVFARPEYYFISSRAVKEIARWGGELHSFLPAGIIDAVKTKIKEDSKK